MSALNSQNDDFQDNDEYETMVSHFRKVATPTFVDDVASLADNDMENTMSLFSIIVDPTAPSWLFGY